MQILDDFPCAACAEIFLKDGADDFRFPVVDFEGAFAVSTAAVSVGCRPRAVASLLHRAQLASFHLGAVRRRMLDARTAPPLSR